MFSSLSLSGEGALRVLNAVKTTPQKSIRAIVSIMAAVALAMPAVPFSEIDPAYADFVSDQAADENLADLPGGTVDLAATDADLENEILQQLMSASDSFEHVSNESTSSDDIMGDSSTSHAQQICVDMPFGGTVDETGQIKLDCGNDTEEGQAAIQEYVQQEEAKDQQAKADAAEALALLEQSPLEDPQETYEREQAEMAGTIVPEGTDPTLALDDFIIKTGDEGQAEAPQAELNSANSAYAAVPDYSMTPVVADIKKVTLYELYRGDIVQDAFWVNSDGTPDLGRNYMFVECNRTPSFYAEVVGGYFLPYQGDRDVYDFPLYRYVVTLKLPSAQGLPAKTVDLLWGFKQNSPSAGYVSVGGKTGTPNLMPAVNDSTILATFAAVDGYDASRTTAYLNAYKMAPFSSAEDIVASGNAAPANSPFATKNITELWPIHKDDGMKVSLLEADAPDIVRNYMYFADGSHVVQDVTYQQSKGLVASYIADDTGMLYQPNMWLMDSVAQKGIDNIASFIRSKTYDGWFTAWMKTKTASKSVTIPRPVRDHFDTNMRNNAEEVAANLMTNVPAWSGTGANTYAWSNIIETAKEATPTDDWKNPQATEIKLFNLLFLYSYYETVMSFDVGGSEELGARKDANLFLATAFRGSVIAGGCSLINMTASVNSTVMLSLSYVQNLQENAFPAMLSRYTGTTSPVTLVERIVTRTTDYGSMANWFADYMRTIAYFWEYEPPKVEGISDNNQLTWRGWDQAKRFPNQVLYWLTLEPGCQYFASTSMMLFTGSVGLYYNSYEMTEDRQNAFKSKLTARFEPAARYAVNVASVVGISRVNAVCVENFDQLASTLDSGGTYLEREGLWGKTLTKDAYHKKFTEGIAIYNANPTGALAMTVNISLQNKRVFFFGRALNISGWEHTLSHEMAHALDNDVFLGGDRRAGTEDYTDGLLTQSTGSQNYIMNLSWDKAKSTEMAANLTRERVMTKAKLNDYYAKMYETLDMLDYAALQAFLRLDKDEQNAVATQLRFDGHNGNSALDSGATAVVLCNRQTVLAEYDGTTATMTTNASVFNDGSKKFETVEEVYDNQIVLKPGITGKTTWVQQNYVADSLAGVWWFPIHNNGNRADSRGFKLLMYQILGREGYDAWANFGRTGGGDLAKLKAITGCDSFKQWQIQTWSEIEAKKDQLGYIGFDSLVDKFEVALRTDASSVDRSLSQMNALRWRMYYMMKRVTDDFRNGIYENQTPVTYIHNLAELQAIAENPYGNYALANDIDASGTGIALSGSLVDGVFYGKLDGQGHKIFAENELLPYVFNNMKQAYVKDLTIAGGVVMRPSLAATNSEWENLDYEVYSHKIYTVDDLLEIPEVSAQGINVFTLMNDLDFSEWSAQNAAAGDQKKLSVITEPIVGTSGQYKEFHSDGHTITGLHGASLFDCVAFMDFHNVTFKDCDNLQNANSGDGVAIVAAQAHKGKFWNLKFENVKVQGKYRVAFVVANDGLIKADATTGGSEAGSQFSRIQVNKGAIGVGSNGCYAGFITGRASNSDFSDIYAHGTLTTNSPYVGGLVGAINKSSRFDRCISNVNIVRNNGNGNNIGVLFGDVESPNVNAIRISSCIGLGSPGTTQANASGRLTKVEALAATMKNCYENASQTYGYTLSGVEGADVGWVRTGDAVACDNSGAAIEFAEDVPDLRNNKDFYTALGFDDSIWDFGVTMQHGFPVLAVLDRSFYEYDLDIDIDYLNERVTFKGTDINDLSTILKGLPVYNLNPNNTFYELGGWVEIGGNRPVLYFTSCMNTDRYVPVGEIIDDERFVTDEVSEKGYRTVTLTRDKAKSGKYASFSKSIQLPVRFDNPYEDALVGVRANSKGMGTIRVVDLAPYDTVSSLEYRLVEAAQGASEGGGEDTAAAATAEGAIAEAGDQSAGDEAAASAEQAEASAASENPWTTMTAAATAVAPGTYEVRTKATNSAFASKPTIVEVKEFDPDAAIFALVLDTKGGEWNEGYEVPVEYNNEEATQLPGAEKLFREGYTFQGWYDNEQFSGKPITEIPAGATDAVSLYARWEPNAYPVTLHLNGGQLQDESANITKYYYGQGVTLPVPEFAGKSFVGWYDNSAFSGDPVTSIGDTAMDSKQFWAKWEAVSYSVTLHLAGGSLTGGMADAFRYESGIGATLPTAAHLGRIGHTFGGWFDNEQCAGTSVGFIAASDSGNKDFWAKWIPNVYDVVLAKNRGVLQEGQQDVTSYTYGTTVALPLLERPGYEFGGWYDNAECSGDPILAIGDAEIGSKQFWAKWIPQVYSITYDLGTDADGAVPPVNLDLIEFGSYVTGTAFPLPDASIMAWPDHTFAGWYDNAEFAGEPLVEIPADVYGPVNLYARWVGEACVVAFHVNGGSLADGNDGIFEFSVDGYQVGDIVPLPGADDISRLGYVFEGWYEDASFSGPEIGSITLAKGNFSLFAKWSLESYAIAYELDGGSWVEGYAPPSAYTIESGAVMLPAAETVHREGFSFKGWSEDPSASGETQMLIPSGSAGGKTFYAQWQSDAVEPPSLTIVSLSIDGLTGDPIVWDENGYARVEVPRDKMPSSPDDFNIVVPEGVRVSSITKRETPVLIRLLSGTRSDIWDIVLRSDIDPTQEASYALELVPVDASEDDGVVGGDNEPGGGSSTGGSGTGSGGTGGTGGSGTGGSTGAGSGTGAAGSGNGGGSYVTTVGSNATGSNGGTSLARTGDMAAPVAIALGGATILAAAVAMIVARRRSSKR